MTDVLQPSRFVARFRFGNYILDFVRFDKRLVIKIDGSQHAGSGRDTTREVAPTAEGFRVARYWNNDVLQRFTSVPEEILSKLAER